MKLKKMRKALKNIDKGAVTVSKKDKKYDLTDCPEKWDDHKIIDSYKTDGKNGGITLVVGGKSGKKRSDDSDSDIDKSLDRMRDTLNRIADSSYQDTDDHKNRHDNKGKDRDHDHKSDEVEKKADDLIHKSRQGENRQDYSRDNRRNRQSRNQRNSQNNSSNSDNTNK